MNFNKVIELLSETEKEVAKIKKEIKGISENVGFITDYFDGYLSLFLLEKQNYSLYSSIKFTIIDNELNIVGSIFNNDNDEIELMEVFKKITEVI